MSTIRLKHLRYTLMITATLLLIGCGGGNDTTDTTPPILKLLGNNPMTLTVGTVYTEPGATATDETDGNLTDAITVIGTVDTAHAGDYTRLYHVSDAAGNEANTTRLIYVLDNALNNSNFPTAYYPTTSAHPRLWLTAERLASLNQHRAHNTVLWQEFKQYCDSIMADTPPNNDLNDSPQNYTAPLALMYRIDGNTTYADKAIELMDKIDDNLSQYGDPDHQSYYFMGLTYDWLYDYAGMTDPKKQAYRTMMKKISDKFYNGYGSNTGDVGASGTDSDFNLLTALHHLVMGIATYDGTDTNATTMLNRAWKGWSEGYCVNSNQCTSNRGMILAGLGGVYFTGMAYFPSTDIIGISGFEMSLKSACGYDVNTQEPNIKPFWGNVLRAIIALTEPTRTAIFDYGSWQDPNSFRSPYSQPWMQRALIIGEYFATQADDNTSADLARGFTAQVDVGGDHNDPFLELFYDTYGATATNPYTANLPRTMVAESPDFLLSRSSWETNASWAVFRGDGSKPLDQRAMDMGAFSLWRDGGYLTKGARNYQALAHGEFFNTLSLENNNNGTAIFNSLEAATISRHRSSEAPLMAYGMLQADDQWDDATTDNIDTYRRHFVWMDPYVVVLDRVRANTSIDITWRLRALNEPTVSGATISQLSDNNRSRLLARIIEPASISLTALDENASLWSSLPNWQVNYSERHWQTQASFTTDTLNILAVMQMGNAVLSTFDTIESLSDANNSGVRIGDRVVCFNHAEGLRSEANYTLHSAANPMRHLVGDLIPGTYRLRINGVTAATLTVADADNTAWFETTTTGTITVSLSKTP